MIWRSCIQWMQTKRSESQTRVCSSISWGHPTAETLRKVCQRLEVIGSTKSLSYRSRIVGAGVCQQVENGVPIYYTSIYQELLPRLKATNALVQLCDEQNLGWYTFEITFKLGMVSKLIFWKIVNFSLWF